MGPWKIRPGTSGAFRAVTSPFTIRMVRVAPCPAGTDSGIRVAVTSAAVSGAARANKASSHVRNTVA